RAGATLFPYTTLFRSVGRVDLDRRRGECRFGITAAAVGGPRAIAEILRGIGGAERILHPDLRLGFAVLHAHERRGLLRPLERVGDRKSTRLNSSHGSI